MTVNGDLTITNTLDDKGFAVTGNATGAKADGLYNASSRK